MPFDGRNSVSGLSGNGSFPLSLLYLDFVLYAAPLFLCISPRSALAHPHPCPGACCCSQGETAKVMHQRLLFRTGFRKICFYCWQALPCKDRLTKSQQGAEPQTAEDAASLPLCPVSSRRCRPHLYRA